MPEVVPLTSAPGWTYFNQMSFELPAIINVFLAFGLILTLNRMKLPLGAALLVGTVIMGTLLGLPPRELAVIIFRSLMSYSLLSLLLIVTLILILSRLMNDSGQLDRIVDSFTGLTDNVRFVSSAMPALIGLLPMPGGALFSAPMVAAASREVEIDPSLKTAINYWFRHIWESWWPLYPGVILAVSLLNVETWQFILVQFPLTIFAIISGSFFLLKHVPRSVSNGRLNSKKRWKTLVYEVAPIGMVVLTVPAVTLFKFTFGLKLPQLTSIFLGLGICLTWVIVQNRIPFKSAVSAALDRSIPPLLFLLVGIMAFKGVLIESGAVLQIHAELSQYGIPSMLVILMLPFLSGFVTGITIAFVGSSFPLIVPLLADYDGLTFLAYGMLAYAVGFMGVMLSPVHLCLQVTKDYFHADLFKTYRHLAGPTAAFLALTLILFGLYLFID